MFVNACAEAAKFTRPVVVSRLRLDGAVETGIGAFVVLNADGWIATAAHIVADLPRYQAEIQQVRDWEARVAQAKAEHTDQNRLRKALQRLPHENTWTRRVSLWWGGDGASIEEVTVFPMVDLAVGRLQGVDLTGFPGYPTFKMPTDIASGTSLVKVGYPFHELQSTWDETTQGFRFNSDEICLFPIEGMHTRILDGGATPDGLPVKFIETSTPGLRGQSGGPTLDRNGRVWAIQSSTAHYELGFKPSVKAGSRAVEEHQFLNVGIGVHPETLEAAFAHAGIVVQWA